MNLSKKISLLRPSLLAESAAGRLGQQYRLLSFETLRKARRNNENDPAGIELSRTTYIGARNSGREDTRLHRQRLHESRAQGKYPPALRSRKTRAQHALANRQ